MFEELIESYNADSRIRRFTSRHFGQIFQTRIMNPELLLPKVANDY